MTGEAELPTCHFVIGASGVDQWTQYRFVLILFYHRPLSLSLSLPSYYIPPVLITFPLSPHRGASSRGGWPPAPARCGTLAWLAFDAATHGAPVARTTRRPSVQETPSTSPPWCGSTHRGLLAPNPYIDQSFSMARSSAIGLNDGLVGSSSWLIGLLLI